MVQFIMEKEKIMKKLICILFIATSVITALPEHSFTQSEQKQPVKSPGHEHDDELLAAGFCAILLHGAAAITAKDDKNTQIKEAAIVAATIVNLLQLVNRSRPEATRSSDHNEIYNLKDALEQLIKSPPFLKELEKQKKRFPQN